MLELGGCFPTTWPYIWPTDSHLTWAEAIGKGGPWGSEILPPTSRTVIWYQLGPSPAPVPLEGWPVGPPEVGGVALWRGADDFPSQLEAVGLPLWLMVRGGSQSTSLRSWLHSPPSGLAAASMAGVPAEDGLAGRSRPLGWDFGTFGIGSP